MIISGLPLLFIGPLVLGSIFWFSTWRLYEYYPWSWFFEGAVLIVVPLLFFSEARHRGGWTQTSTLGSDQLPEADDPWLPNVPWDESGMLAAFVINPRLASAGIVEVFLVGPKLVLDGVVKLRRARQLGDVSLERAAEVIAQLSTHDSGVLVTSLLHEGETKLDLIRVLCLLVFHDWIGVSKTGNRVWLLSEARQHLTS